MGGQCSLTATTAASVRFEQLLMSRFLRLWPISLIRLVKSFSDISPPAFHTCVELTCCCCSCCCSMMRADLPPVPTRVGELPGGATGCIFSRSCRCVYRV